MLKLPNPFRWFWNLPFEDVPEHGLLLFTMRFGMRFNDLRLGTQLNIQQSVAELHDFYINRQVELISLCFAPIAFMICLVVSPSILFLVLFVLSWAWLMRAIAAAKYAKDLVERAAYWICPDAPSVAWTVYMCRSLKFDSDVSHNRSCSV